MNHKMYKKSPAATGQYLESSIRFYSPLLIVARGFPPRPGEREKSITYDGQLHGRTDPCLGIKKRRELEKKCIDDRAISGCERE